MASPMKHRLLLVLLCTCHLAAAWKLGRKSGQDPEEVGEPLDEEDVIYDQEARHSSLAVTPEVEEHMDKEDGHYDQEAWHSSLAVTPEDEQHVEQSPHTHFHDMVDKMMDADPRNRLNEDVGEPLDEEDVIYDQEARHSSLAGTPEAPPLGVVASDSDGESPPEAPAVEPNPPVPAQQPEAPVDVATPENSKIVSTKESDLFHQLKLDAPLSTKDEQNLQNPIRQRQEQQKLQLQRVAQQQQEVAQQQPTAAQQLRAPTQNDQLAKWREASSKVQQQSQESCVDWQCSENSVPKSDQVTLFGETDAACCDDTCAKFTCSNGFVANPKYSKNVGDSNEMCCDKTCNGFQCDAHYAIPQAKLGLAANTHEECCEPTCALHNCSSLWRTATHKASWTGASDSVCCDPLCGLFECKDGWTVDDLKVDQVGDSNETCCAKTCKLMTCPVGFAMPSAKSESTHKVSNSSDCCEPTCRQHTCSDGYQKDASKDALFAPTDALCCHLLCKAYTCPTGMVSDTTPGVPEEIADGPDNCCDETCSLHDCSDGWANDSTKAALVENDENARNASCCAKTCKQFTCPPTTTLAEGVNDTIGDSDFACCVDARCKNMTATMAAEAPGEDASQWCNGRTVEVCNKTYARATVNMSAQELNVVNHPDYDGPKTKKLFLPCHWDEVEVLCRLKGSREGDATDGDAEIRCDY